MTDSQSRRKSLRNKLLFVFGGLLVLLVALYFVVTSAGFLKAVILPRVSKSMNADITVEGASLSPFSRVALQGVKVHPHQQAPLLHAKEAIVRYSLRDIVGGKLTVHEVRLVSPTITVTVNADGSSNLDPLLETGPKEDPKEKEPSKPDKPPAVNIRDVTLKDATVRLVQKHAGGAQTVVEITSLDLSIDRLQNGQPGKLALSSGVRIETPSPTPAANGLQAAATADFTFALAEDLQPRSVQGSAHLQVSQADGELAELAGLRTVLASEITPTEIKQLSLRFSRAEADLGEVRVQGPFNLAQQEGKLSAEIVSIDRHALNLIGAPLGIDFGSTTLASSNEVELSKGGRFIAVNGKLTGRSLTLTKDKQTTPSLDLEANYNLTVDQPAQKAQLQTLTLRGTQNQQPLLHGALTQPMLLDWSESGGDVGDSAFNLTLTNLNLADWQAFTGDLSLSGKVNTALTLLSRKAGQHLEFTAQSQIANLSALIGTNKIDQADITLSAAGHLDQFAKLQLSQLDGVIAQKGARVAAVSGEGAYHLETQAADLQTALELFLPKLSELIPDAGVHAQSGTLRVTSRITQKPDANNNLLLTLDGNMTGSAISVIQDRQTTPPLDLQASYGVTVDATNETAVIRTLQLSATENQQPILRGTLSRPMQVSWGGTLPATEDSSFDLKITALNLANWRAFLAQEHLAGKLDLDARLLSQRSGQKITFDVDSRITGLTYQLDATNRIEGADVTLNTRGEVSDLADIQLSRLQAELAEAQQPFASLSGSGRYNIETEEADLQLKADAVLAGLSRKIKFANLTASSGSVQFDGRVSQKANAQSVAGTLKLAGFTGRFEDYVFDNFGAEAQCDISQQAHLMEIRRCSGTFTQAGQPGGNFQVTGRYDAEKELGQFDLKLVNVNANGVRPFLEPSLGEKKLVSVAINGSASADYNARKASTFKADLKLGNLVVRDPKKPQADPPLQAGFLLDAAMDRQVLDLRKAQFTLSPTARAKNELLLTGQLDLSNTNGAAGRLKVFSEAFDVTDFYNLYAPAETPAEPAAKKKEPTPPPQEPDPVTLPVRQLALEMDIKNFYLREMAITDLQSSAQVTSNRLVLKPLQLKMNNAPMTANADVNLGVRGWIYDLAFQIDKLPLEPIANTFMPESRGQYQGLIIANGRLQGAGMTGASLRTNLNGQFDLSFTNANIQLVGPRWKMFFTPIAVVLRAPDLLDSPLNSVALKGQAGDGALSVTQCTLISPAFFAETQGKMPIADVLMDSRFNNWPMAFHLRRSLAQKAGLAPRDLPPDAQYVRLPDFIRVAGTLDDPKADLNKAAIAGTALDKIGDKIGGEAGDALRGLGGILGGRGSQTNQPGTTNQPPPAKQPLDAQDVLDLFKRKPKN